MKLLFVGDVVGKPGRKALGLLEKIIGRERIDFTVVNIENAAGGFGVRDVDGLGVEGEAARAHAGHRDEGAGAVAVDLEEEVFAFLGGHWRRPCLRLEKRE